MKRKLFGSKKRASITSAVVALFLIGGAAFAAWLVFSDGFSKGGLGALQAPTVVPGTTAPNDLVPSTQFTGSVAVKVTNPNASQLYITAAAVPQVGADNNWSVSGGLNPAGCTTAIFKPHLTGQAFAAAPGAGIMVNGSGTNGGITEVLIPAVLKADNTTPSDCQGAVLNNLPAPQIQFSTSP